MKKFLICVERDVDVFSDSLNHAEEYGLEILKDLPDGTPVHIFKWENSVTKSGVAWAKPMKAVAPKTNGHKRDVSAPMKHQRWSKTEIALLRDLYAHNEHSDLIAQTLGRTKSAIWAKASELGLRSRSS